jgi:hypothetical protein
MSVSIASAVFANLVTLVCAMVVAKRSSNWRIRLLALAMGLLTMCQITVTLGNHRIWLSSEVGDAAESLELLVSAICLTVLHLLNRENRDRRNTDERLRVAEAPYSVGNLRPRRLGAGVSALAIRRFFTAITRRPARTLQNR